MHQLPVKKRSPDATQEKEFGIGSKIAECGNHSHPNHDYNGESLTNIGRAHE
jgi:hypothetical protein